MVCVLQNGSTVSLLKNSSSVLPILNTIGGQSIGAFTMLFNASYIVLLGNLTVLMELQVTQCSKAVLLNISTGNYTSQVLGVSWF